VPSKLPATALDLAEQLITMPASKRSAGRAVEREAGYVLLGALCVSLPAEILQVPLCLDQAPFLEFPDGSACASATGLHTPQFRCWWGCRMGWKGLDSLMRCIMVRPTPRASAEEG